MDNQREIKHLEFRRTIAKFCIETLQTVKDDPRQAEALAEYERQLQEIETKLAALKPPAIVVGLKTAALFGKSK